jgi:hypothetical protein
MSTPTPQGPHAVIAAALYDWWLTADPLEQFHAPAVAEHVETHLLSSGYVIAPDTRKSTMPKRRDIATAILLALACTTAAILATIVNDWLWGAFGALGAAVLTHQAAIDIRDRHRAKNTR